MVRFSFRRSPSFVVSIGAVAAATAIATIVACSSSSSSNAPSGAATGSGADSGSGGTSTVSTAAGSCANSTVEISFSPMYSAYIAASTHTFQIPAITADGSSAEWSISDPSQAQLAAQQFDGLPGVMITVQGNGASGQLTVYATKSDGTCGSAVLNITSATDDDWEIGNARYNDGVALHLPSFDGGRPEGGGPPDGGGFGDGDGGRRDGGGPPHTRDGGSFLEVDGGTACTNCHGATASGGLFNDVAHTPEQTGGFSDDQLIAIIRTGTVPDGGYFDPTVIDANCDGGDACTKRAYQSWQNFHRWTDITDDQYKGIVIYLRSLQPTSQTGKSNFGGRGRPPGGQ